MITLGTWQKGPHIKNALAACHAALRGLHPTEYGYITTRTIVRDRGPYSGTFYRVYLRKSKPHAFLMEATIAL